MVGVSSIPYCTILFELDGYYSASATQAASHLSRRLRLLLKISKTRLPCPTDRGKRQGKRETGRALTKVFAALVARGNGITASLF